MTQRTARTCPKTPRSVTLLSEQVQPLFSLGSEEEGWIWRKRLAWHLGLKVNSSSLLIVVASSHAKQQAPKVSLPGYMQRKKGN